MRSIHSRISPAGGAEGAEQFGVAYELPVYEVLVGGPDPPGVTKDQALSPPSCASMRGHARGDLNEFGHLQPELRISLTAGVAHATSAVTPRNHSGISIFGGGLVIGFLFAIMWAMREPTPNQKGPETMPTRFSSYLAGGPDVMGPAAETMLGALIREPGSADDAARAIARRLDSGSLHLTGAFRGCEREVAREVLTDGR